MFFYRLTEKIKWIIKKGEMKFYIYPVVIKNNDDLILIDTGYPMFLLVIEKAFEKKGLDIRKVKGYKS